MELINEFFDNIAVRGIFNTLLLALVAHDMSTWKFEKDDGYTT